MRAASALALALCAAAWCASARAQVAAAVASAALTSASAVLEGVVVPALQFAARGPRGVQERATYARYIARGPYAVGWRNLPAVPKTEGDWSWEVLSALASGNAFSTTFPARLFYPSAFGGRDAPLASGTAPVPLLGFAVGWTCDASMYEATLSHLASHGIMTVVPLFNDMASQPLLQVNFRSQLSQILSAVAFVGAQGRAGAGPAFNDATAGSWAGRVNASRFALAGHSAGGGVALQGAAEAGRRVAAVATLGAWVNVATTPWLSSLPSAVTAPALLLSGEWDEHAPLADNGQRVYDALTSPKLLPVIAGGSHCFLDWTAASDVQPLLGLLPWYGYSSCPAAQVAALPPPAGRGGVGMRDQMALSATHLAAFLRLYLLNDTDAAPLVWGDAMRRNSWMSSVQMAPGAALSAQQAAVEATAQGVTLDAQLANLGVAPGTWALTATAFLPAVAVNASDAAADAAVAANASVADMLREQLAAAAPAPAASGLRLRLSGASMALDADADAVARQRSAALLPRAPALAAALAAFRRSPPPAPPRRLLLQLPPASASAGGFSVEVDASMAAPGNHTVVLAARSLADGGSTCYASVAVFVPDAVGLAPAPDGGIAQSGAPLVSALAGAASSQLGRLAAALAVPAPPAVSALAGPPGTWLARLDPKAVGASAAAAASEALAALARAAAVLPPQPTVRDAAQAMAMQWLQALSASGISWSALGGAAGAALASLRASLLIRVGFGALVSPPPAPPPPQPPALPQPPPPTALSAAADLLRGLDRLLHPVP